MKLRTLIATVVILLASVASFGQVTRDSKSAASGESLTFQNSRGYASQMFEYVISGSPTTASIVLKGCMAGTTCDTLETSTANTSGIRNYNTVYDYYTVAPTFSGGTAPAVRVNVTFAPTSASVVADPCASASYAKSSAAVAFSSATTAALVTGVAGKKVFVCAFTVTMSSGTTPTLQFKTGTGGTCGTATATLTGVMALPTASGTLLTIGAGHTAFSGIASGDLCLTTAGTTPTGNGWLTYVQQ